VEVCTAEGSMQQVDGNILKLFCNFDMNGLDNSVFGLTGERGCHGGSPSSWGEGFGGFISIPDSLVMEAQSNRGPFGFRQQRRPSNTSVRCQRLVCLWI